MEREREEKKTWEEGKGVREGDGERKLRMCDGETDKDEETLR